MKCTTEGCSNPPRPRKEGVSGQSPRLCVTCTDASAKAQRQRRNERMRSPVGPLRAVKQTPAPVAPKPRAEDRDVKPANPLIAAAAAPGGLTAATRTAIERAARAAIRENHRVLELLAHGASPWSCEDCGPLTARELPVHGADERMHCPRCDAECSTGVAAVVAAEIDSQSAWKNGEIPQ